ncbi:MAG TPA: PilZ domain-containing protein [Rhizomicrobium sp.]|nr:PilZ domain-containing protein [Rhizomicrobium sp.]
MKPELEPVIEKAKAERRRFKRVRVDLPGRLFVPVESREAACTVLDMSPGGAAVECEGELPGETQVVLYIDGFGRFEGQIVNRTPNGYGVRFNCTAMKRERVAEQLTLFANKTLVSEADLRRHDRAPAKGFTRFTRADGETVKCEVLDLSLSGVSLRTNVRPPIGEFVLIGQMAGRVARVHETGIAIEFVGGHAAEKAATTDKLKAKLVAVR